MDADPSPRKRFVRHESDGAARFLTFSCYRRLPLFRNDRIKSRFVDRLTRSAAAHRVAIFAWVVMPEHVHLVVWPDSAGDVTTFLKSLKSPLANEVLARWRDLDAAILPRVTDASGRARFWQHGGGHDRIVIEELAEKIRYCHRNPAVRGLCNAGVDWRWSSARAYDARADYEGPPIAFDALPRLRRPLT